MLLRLLTPLLITLLVKLELLLLVIKYADNDHYYYDNTKEHINDSKDITNTKVWKLGAVTVLSNNQKVVITTVLMCSPTIDFWIQ